LIGDPWGVAAFAEREAASVETESAEAAEAAEAAESAEAVAAGEAAELQSALPSSSS
jgi:hypothetical protein